jgi:RimJ/RimL family protein N-acetyltransferase
MDLIFTKFQREYYPEYASWYADPELNKRLGPMDESWLNYVLSEDEEKGVTWAIFLVTEMVAVIHLVFDPQGILPCGITDIAIKPTRRRQGIATAIIHQLLAEHYQQGMKSHIAYIKDSNQASRYLFEKIGFFPNSEPDKNGFIEYRYDMQ